MTFPHQAPTPPVLRIDGELDIATAGGLTALLEPAVTGSAAEVVLLTLGVTFIDCAGLSPILRAVDQLQQRQARLCLPLPSAALVRLARLTHCSHVLGLAEARTAAPLRAGAPAVDKRFMGTQRAMLGALEGQR